MKQTIILAAAVMSLLAACKKSSNNNPGPNNTTPTVVSKAVTLENYDTQPNNEESATWFSVKDLEAHSMQEIAANVELQKEIIFGYNLNQVSWGIHSPSAYPQPYGQDAWSTKNTTVFKQAPLTPKDFVVIRDENPDTITVDFINDMFAAGFSPSATLENFNVGDVFVFEAKNGAVRGIIVVDKIDNKYQDVTLQTWVVK